MNSLISFCEGNSTRSERERERERERGREHAHHKSGIIDVAHVLAA